MDASTLGCQPLTEANLDDLLNFMETDAFSDNPQWRTCYCVFHYLSDRQDGNWGMRTGADNRMTLTQMVAEKRGLWIVAYRENRIVGWVNADISSAFRRYAERGVKADPKTGIVACFLVAPGFRRRGIAAQLLDAAVKALWEKGVNAVDAYVIVDPKGLAETEKDLGSDQLAHHGPLTMYLKAGFKVIDQQGVISHVRLEKTEGC